MSTPKCWLLGGWYSRWRNVHQQWHRPSGVKSWITIYVIFHCHDYCVASVFLILICRFINNDNGYGLYTQRLTKCLVAEKKSIYSVLRNNTRNQRASHLFLYIRLTLIHLYLKKNKSFFVGVRYERDYYNSTDANAGQYQSYLYSIGG